MNSRPRRILLQIPAGRCKVEVLIHPEPNGHEEQSPFRAWRQLAKEKRLLCAAVGGIAFAVVLILFQWGIKESLLNSSGLLYSHLKCQLALVNPEYQYVLSTKDVSKRRMYQALGFPG